MFTLNIEESKSLEYGINVHKLKSGTVILVLTKNTLYKIIKGETDEYDVTIQGGKYFVNPTVASFSGSTFGGSMLKVGWIGYGMYMEIYSPSHKNNYKTTPVLAARVIGDGWEYDMEWDKMSKQIKIIKQKGDV